MKEIKIFKLIFILIISIIVIYFILLIYNNYQIKNQQKILHSIKELKKEFIPVKLKFENFENNKIIYILKFYDLDNKVIGTYKNSITGQMLFLDFKVIKINSYFLFFPVTIFSDTIAPFSGTDITYFYTKNNFPMIYYSKNNSNNFNNLIKSAWSFINSDNPKTINNLNITYDFGNAIHIIQKIETIDLDSIYYYVCHIKKGGIEIIKK